jgi:hypothetical protein
MSTLINLREKIDRLSIIARQCVAAVCFDRYCRFHKLQNSDISAFLDHLWRVGKINSPDEFGEWEEGFQMLRASGWGEPVPEDVLGAIPLALREEYLMLAGFVIETSATTWYGNNLEGTREYLLKVMYIVASYGIELPDLSVFMTASPELHGGWGNNPSPEEFDRWRYNS